ncbi:MAG: phage baseplate protein [Chloroflexi bacterium 13_1_20CM_50_12]|nr:MAG: phage baseplate protein [Chloroflexi bacterium 13_1_20CM_50_12]
MDQHPVDRALTMLAAALPELPPEKLLALSIGQRDAYLLTIHERNFGGRFASFARCQECQEQLEFVLDVADMRVVQGSEITDQVQEMTAEGVELHFRLPNSLDLAAISSYRDIAAARNQLVKRCVLQACQDSHDVAAEALPEAVLAAIASQMIELDPQADVQLDLTCPACGHGWPVIFDIVAFCWSEVCAAAKRLLQEVHILALAYGWREADILSMGAIRRQFYLEMVT